MNPLKAFAKKLVELGSFQTGGVVQHPETVSPKNVFAVMEVTAIEACRETAQRLSRVENLRCVATCLHDLGIPVPYFTSGPISLSQCANLVPSHWEGSFMQANACCEALEILVSRRRDHSTGRIEVSLVALSTEGHENLIEILHLTRDLGTTGTFQTRHRKTGAKGPEKQVQWESSTYTESQVKAIMKSLEDYMESGDGCDDQFLEDLKVIRTKAGIGQTPQPDYLLGPANEPEVNEAIQKRKERYAEEALF